MISRWDFPGDPVVKTSPSNSGDVGSVSAWGAKIPHALCSKNQNIKQKQYCTRFNEYFKNGPYPKKMTSRWIWSTKFRLGSGMEPTGQMSLYFLKKTTTVTKELELEREKSIDWDEAKRHIHQSQCIDL